MTPAEAAGMLAASTGEHPMTGAKRTPLEEGDAHTHSEVEAGSRWQGRAR